MSDPEADPAKQVVTEAAGILAILPGIRDEGQKAFRFRV